MNFEVRTGLESNLQATPGNYISSNKTHLNKTGINATCKLWNVFNRVEVSSSSIKSGSVSQSKVSPGGPLREKGSCGRTAVSTAHFPVNQENTSMKFRHAELQIAALCLLVPAIKRLPNLFLIFVKDGQRTTSLLTYEMLVFGC